MKKMLTLIIFIVSLTAFIYSMEPDPDVGLFDREIVEPCQIHYTCPGPTPCSVWVQGELKRCSGWGFMCTVIVTFCLDSNEATTAQYTCEFLCGP